MISTMTTSLHSLYQLRRNKIHKFKPKIIIYKEVGPYILKTATTHEELLSALKLRFHVFHHEMIGKKQSIGIDVDSFDLHCDHLIIVNKKNNDLVGTYRLNSTLFSNNFYSEQEFDLSEILNQPGNKIELGRACIHKNYRNGITISLLWRGIAEYMMATQSQILFGCASVKIDKPRESALLYRYFKNKNLCSDIFSSSPTVPYTMPQIQLWLDFLTMELTESEIKEAESLIPSLLKSYLKVGAKITGVPAWDAEFKCIDFLTVMDRDQLSQILWKKYTQVN